MRLKFFIKEYTWLVVLVAVVISFVWPQLGMVFKPYLSYLLMLLMLLSCLNIDLKQIMACLVDYKEKLVVLLIIHLASVILVWFLRPMFSPEIYLGLIIATAISAGMSVVFLAGLYDGIPEKALLIMSVSNLISPFVVPLLVKLFAGAVISISISDMMWKMVKLVILPLILAVILGRQKVCGGLKDSSVFFSIVVLFLLILGIVSPVRDLMVQNLSLTLWLAGLIAVFNIISFALGYLVGSDRKESITYAISASYKNFTLATVLALSSFGPMVALPAVVYTLVNNLLLIPLQLMFVKSKKG